MSTSSENRLGLTVTTSDPVTEIFVQDDRFRLVKRGVGTLEAPLEPGIYQVKIRMGHATDEQLVALRDKPEVVHFHPLKFFTPAPLEASTTFEMGLAEAAERESGHVHDRPGAGSSLFVFVRDWRESGRENEGVAPANPAEGLVLLELDGETVVSDLAAKAAKPSGPGAYAACTVALDPKPYRLRLRLPSGEAIDQTIIAVPGWQAQVFLLLRDYDPTGARRADLASAGHLLVPWQEPREDSVFSRSSRSARLTELARIGLSYDRQLLSDTLIDELLHAKFEDPLLGIYGALMLMLKSPLNAEAFAARDRALRQLAEAPGVSCEFRERIAKNPLDAATLEALAGNPALTSSALESLRSFSVGVRQLRDLSEVIRNLRWILGGGRGFRDHTEQETLEHYFQHGGHPDVEALAAYVRHAAEELRNRVGAEAAVEIAALDPAEPPPVFPTPPMLRRSWALILGISADRPEIVPADSLTARAARSVWGPEPWLLWMEPAPGPGTLPASAPDTDLISVSVKRQAKRLWAAQARAGGIQKGGTPPFESIPVGGSQASATAPASPAAEETDLMHELVRSTGQPRASLARILSQMSSVEEAALSEPAGDALAFPREPEGVLSAFTRFFMSAFSSKSQHLVWRRLDEARIAEEPDCTPHAGPIAPDQAYFAIRLKEMYVREARRLWQQYYPVLHSFVEHQGAKEEAVAGPGQLSALGNAGLDRIVNQNHLLAGPTPYRGGDVKLIVGLYSVPGGDVAKALIDTVGEITKLGGIALGEVPQIADAVKAGIERALGLKETKLQIGIQDSFSSTNPLRPGLYVGIAAEEQTVPLDQLWFGKGRLREGSAAGKPFDGPDYLVIAIERLDTRSDWARLPGLPDMQAKFDANLADATLSVTEKKAKLNDLWGPFTTLLASSPHLTKPDRAGIARDVAAELRARLETPPPFATPAGAELARRPTEDIGPEVFRFDHVRRVVDITSPESLRQAEAALTVPPFPPPSRPGPAASASPVHQPQELAREAGPPALSGVQAQWIIPLQVSISVGTPIAATVGAAASVTPAAKLSAPQTARTGGLSRLDEALIRDAKAELARSATRTYLDETAESAAKASYYRGVPPGESPEAFFKTLSALLESTHRNRPSYAPVPMLYPWVDLQPDMRIKSVYSGQEFDPLKLIEMDAEIDRARAEQLEAFRATESAADPAALELQEALLEASLPYNCEHSVPQSWFNKQEPMRGDLHHLFACESGCNSFRGNTPYFDFRGAKEVIRTGCGRREANRFQPTAGLGAVARATLYFLLRYPHAVRRGPTTCTEDRIKMLLGWHKEDPVGKYERHRNQAIFEVQGNRNPLIDHPEWVDKIDFCPGLG